MERYRKSLERSRLMNKFQRNRNDLIMHFVEKICEKESLHTYSIGNRYCCSDCNAKSVPNSVSKTIRCWSAKAFRNKLDLHPHYRKLVGDYESLVEGEWMAHDNAHWQLANVLVDTSLQEKSQELNFPYWKKLLLWTHDARSLEELATGDVHTLAWYKNP